MATPELIAHVQLKPNCDLENTRAALILRRIERLCDEASSYPENIGSDMDTIPYLREYGFYLRFSSPIPEQVLAVVKGCFFVETCILVYDKNAIPPYSPSRTKSSSSDTPFPEQAFDLSASYDFERDELMAMLVKFNEILWSLSHYTAHHDRDQQLNAITYEFTQAVDALRTAAAFSRLEPFGRIEAPLRELIETQARTYNVEVHFNMYENHVEVERRILAPLEEVLKRLIKMCIRDNIEKPEERRATGKLPYASISLSIEYDGATITCRSEHDGRAFDSHSVGLIAQKRGMLTRPLETYTDEELGSLALLPHFLEGSQENRTGVLFELSEIGTILQRLSGSGSIRNTERETVETTLTFPAAFVALDVVLFTVNGAHLALPALQIARFEAYSDNRIVEENGHLLYIDNDGLSYPLLNGADAATPLATNKPRIVILLDNRGKRAMLGVDSVEGYLHTIVDQLPPVLGRHLEKAAGCVGYLVRDDASIHAVVSARHLLEVIPADEEVV